MSRGAHLPQKVYEVITSVWADKPSIEGKVALERVNRELKGKGIREIGLSTVQKHLSKCRQERKVDRPWSMAALETNPIEAAAIPSIRKVQKYIHNLDLVTTRELRRRFDLVLDSGLTNTQWRILLEEGASEKWPDTLKEARSLLESPEAEKLAPRMRQSVEEIVRVLSGFLEHPAPRHVLSIRQAVWISRLYTCIDDTSDKGIERLHRLSSLYAQTELMHELAVKPNGKEFDTLELDKLIDSSDSDIELYAYNMISDGYEGKSNFSEAGEVMSNVTEGTTPAKPGEGGEHGNREGN